MASYNQSFYRDVDSTGTGHTMVLGSSDKLTSAGTITNSGTLTNSGTIACSAGSLLTFAANSAYRFTPDSMTTASTAAMAVRGFTTIKSTKTAKTIQLSGTGMTVGDVKLIWCTNASATGKVTVDMGTGGVTFDGSNYMLAFKKSATGVMLMKVSATRCIELWRSVADGTALTSTTT